MSALSGPCAKYIVEYEHTAEEAFQRSDPLEDLIAPEGDDPQINDLNIRSVPDNYASFSSTHKPVRDGSQSASSLKLPACAARSSPR